MRHGNPITNILAAVLVLIAPAALACSCITSGDAISGVARADAVFRARVLANVMVLTNEDGSVIYKNEPETPTGYAQRIVVLRVDGIFKGTVAPVTTLVTGSGGGDCGYGFEDGKEYVVFATASSEKRMTGLTGSPKVFTTSICSFTQPATDADLLATLAKKYPPKRPVWVSWP